MRFDGRRATALDARSLASAVERLRTEGVQSVAVCYLHSYRDARHEQETRRLLARRLPAAYISLSSEVLPQIKEYERFGTTVVNAYVGPALSGYLRALAARLEPAGFAGEVLIMQSHGGVATIDDSIRLAAGAVLSTVPWFAFPAMAAHVPALEPVVSAAAGMTSSAIVTVNLWLDRPLAEAAFLLLLADG